MKEKRCRSKLSQNMSILQYNRTGNGIIGGLYSKSDGCVDPTGLTNSFAKGAKMAGATIVEDCPVERIVRFCDWMSYQQVCGRFL